MTYDGLRFFLPRPQCKAYYSLSMSMMHSMLGGEIFPLVSDTNCLANHRISQPTLLPPPVSANRYETNRYLPFRHESTWTLTPDAISQILSIPIASLSSTNTHACLQWTLGTGALTISVSFVCLLETKATR